MKQTRIVSELIIFFESGNHSAARLSRESGVNTATISRLRTGAQRDVSSEFADALRAAMRRLTATPTSPPAPGSPGAAADAAAPAKRRRGRPRRHPDGTPATGGGAEQGTSGAPGCDAGAA